MRNTRVRRARGTSSTKTRKAQDTLIKTRVYIYIYTAYKTREAREHVRHEAREARQHVGHEIRKV